jgi:hypothetical protein
MASGFAQAEDPGKGAGCERNLTSGLLDMDSFSFFLLICKL